MKRILIAIALAAAVVVRPAFAQLDNKQAPIVIGHYHLNVTSVEAHKKFWVDTLGGTATKIGSVDAIRFPGVLLLLKQQKPTGPTKGTTFDHIGFALRFRQ